MSEREIRELASKAERSLVAARRLLEAGDYDFAAIAEDQARAGLQGAHRFVRAVVERLGPILGSGGERSKEPP